MGLIDARIPASALHARAFEAHEIDGHPDAARIWATIRDVKKEAQEEAGAGFGWDDEGDD